MVPAKTKLLCLNLIEYDRKKIPKVKIHTSSGGTSLSKDRLMLQELKNFYFGSKLHVFFQKIFIAWKNFKRMSCARP